MSEIRAGVSATAATTGNFTGFGAPTPCSPLVYDPDSGDIYVLLPGDVVLKVGYSVASADLQVANRVFNKSVTAPANREDSATHLSGRVFERPVMPVENKTASDTMLMHRSINRQVMPAPDLRQLLDVLAASVFLKHQPIGTGQAILGDASSVLAAQVFGKKFIPAMWT